MSARILTHRNTGRDGHGETESDTQKVGHDTKMYMV